MEQIRRPFQGVLNILDFNRHFYVIGLAILVTLFVSRWFLPWPHILFWVIVFSFIYGLIMPLIISAYVYDFSGYYDFAWLKDQIPNNEGINSVISINAGFDETSFIIKRLIPNADLKVFDFYNPESHTEQAIVRARNVSQTYPGTRQIETNSIPLEDYSVDVIFLLSAVHEIRSHQEKIQFLKECNRVCKRDGKVIMVEHLRDFPNFVAFTVGFTHFFSRLTWKHAFKMAGFTKFEETKFTPFMSIFNCSR